MMLFTLAEAELCLDHAALEIQAQRHERQTLLLQRAQHAPQLARVQKQLAIAARLVLREERPLAVRRDVDVDKPGLACFHADVSVGEREDVDAQALDLGAGEHETRLQALADEVFVEGPAIARDELDAVVPRASLECYGFFGHTAMKRERPSA